MRPMRAWGLGAGLVLLVAGWLGWFATSGPHRGPLALLPERQAAAAPRLAEVQPDPAPAVLDPLSPTPVLAETLQGDSLADVAREMGLPGSLMVIAAEEPPALLALACAPAGQLEFLETAPHPDPAFIGALRVPPEGAWVSLFLGDVLLATRRVSPGQATLRFVLPAEFLRERVLLGTPVS